jgi:hypothetical protein
MTVSNKDSSGFLVDSAREFSKNGRWFRDANGRYILFRGVNFGSRSKMTPYLPIAPLNVTNIDDFDLEKEIELVRDSIGLLKHLGFNIVRLLVIWKAIEPHPNGNLEELLPEGKKYLSVMCRIIDLLYEYGLHVILDFHQDIAHEIFGGDGFPDWALALDGKYKRPKPATMRDKKWQVVYMVNKLQRHTLESFWNNDLTNQVDGLYHYPVRTHFEKTIGQTVKFFKGLNNGQGHPAILGIEAFNEPHPAGIGKDRFEKEMLYQYYMNVNSEVRKYDDRLFLLIEPRVDWTVSANEDKKSAFGGPVKLKNLFNSNFIRDVMVEGKMNPKNMRSYLPSDPHSLSPITQRGVFSFHFYDTMAIAGSFLKVPENLYKIRREWPGIFSQLVEAAVERNLIPFLTEFGGLQESEQIREYLNLSFVQIESFLINSTLWNYDLYNTEEGKDNWNLENYSVLGPNRVPRNTDVIARPYPIRSSAEPKFLFFDIKTKYAAVILEGTVEVPNHPTMIYVPFNVHYSPEFFVWATSDEIKWDRQNQILYWYPNKDCTVNAVILGKDHAMDKSALPKIVKEVVDENNLFGLKFS